MNEQFVTYEIALKLKKLGFDEQCIATYMTYAVQGDPFQYNLDYHTKVQLDHNLCPKNSTFDNDWVVAPLWQQVIDWFRIHHEIHITIFRSFTMSKSYHYHILVKRDYDNDFLQESTPNRTYETCRNDSILKAIKLCQKIKKKKST